MSKCIDVSSLENFKGININYCGCCGGGNTDAGNGNNGGSGISGDFTIIYPNDGTEENPAEIFINQRIVMDNPFPGSYVNCEAQVYYKNKWGNPCFALDPYNKGWGTGAHQLLPEDKIIIQTGNRAILGGSISNGNPFDIMSLTEAEIPTVAKCRVLVWKISPIE